VLRSVKLSRLSRDGFGLIQNHFFIAKINRMYPFYLELVLDASKTIFFIAKISQIVCILYRVGIGRIQNHFFSAKISQIVRFSLGMVLDAS
jgi:hypothetical protein